jgi:peptide/nickel transport system substrate-binding protein
MTMFRRSVLKRSLAASTLAGAPAIARGQTRAGGKVVRAVMHGDIPTFDPIWTTANMAAYHGIMVYDTLFGIDQDYRVQPQMVSRWGLSDDKLTYSFELRDGLRWHDGTAVTAADCVASIRRWAARDGAGQHMMPRVKDIAAKDEKTFTIALKEPYGLVIEALAKTSTPLSFMMRKKDAETDPMQKVAETVGSGPFTLNLAETKLGSHYVYDRNPNYVPRGEAPSGIAGGKVVKLDRVILQVMPDSQTAVSALQAGEIDFFEMPPIDLLPQLESDRNIKIDVLNKAGNIGSIHPNFLHPPFNNVNARRALLYLVKQEDFLKATFSDPRYYRTCGAYLACGTAMENDANTDWFKGGQNIARARELFKEAGYDGKPVVLMQATNIDYMRNSAEILAQALRQAGVNVQMIPMDWANVVQRRSVKSAPDQGGWNLFITSGGAAETSNPIGLFSHTAVGEKGWFGWAQDEKHEELRTKWAMAPTLEERRAVARELQANAWSFVPRIYYGQWLQPVAHRANLRGFAYISGVIPFWNVERV